MSERIIFDYFTGQESEMLSFYRIPKLLFTDAYFKGLGVYAKTLYGLMLDRMSLSLKNKWFDEQQRAFIYFAQQEAADMLGVKADKIRDLYKELEQFGLIERKKQGQGKPMIIYLKNFTSEGEEQNQTTEISGSEQKLSVSDHENIGVKTTEKSESRPRQNLSLDHGKTGANYNNTNNTNLVTITNHISSMKLDLNDEYNAYAEIIRENLAVDIMLERYPGEEEIIEGIYDLVLETVLCQKSTIWISKNEYPTNLVKSKFLKLNNLHLEYVMGCMKDNTTKIRNIKNYMLAALFNAPTTMSSYFQSEYSHDRACGYV
ncbi:DUF6017 domain-containing protein [Butyrivibrio sp. INlla16]|uniref:DUF6017 domain-containing protein n=1 Tax=Butyrivibrio sp. INlla16 TaxID=1520807 RepID=UPI00088CA8AD|nr:DUF6017 domain-containing protein [Butyrivibrio sp. INlla16]SDB52309.1 Replication initiator protein A (RepA) N-terminus [Butyrivibrio sp. INlla16]